MIPNLSCFEIDISCWKNLQEKKERGEKQTCLRTKSNEKEREGNWFL